MHKALRDVLGEHVEQKGSLVTAESTRFDISHPQAVTSEEIAEVERRVNEAILANVAVNAAIMSMEDAQKTGAMMLFGEKYGDEVRVLQMGGFSTELCGGTHVSRTGDIGLFKIISEGGIAAGVRRIEAITGLNALKWAQDQERLVKDIIAETKAQTEKDVLAKIQAGAAHAKALEKELGMEIPIDYKKFLLDVSNGLDILVGTFCLDGLRRNYKRSTDESRQPFSIITANIRERPRNAADDHFFIGSYDWGGSYLYIDKRTSTVHYCDRADATSLFQWETFEQMLISELKRIYSLFDERGRKIDEDLYTTPIKR